MHDIHRAFLQNLLSASALSEKDALALLTALVKAYNREVRDSPYRHYAAAAVTKATVDDCISVLNKELDFFALKITKAHCAADNAFHYGIVNLSNDEHAKKATSLTPQQVAYFSRVKAAIEEAGEQGGSIERMQAENLNQGLQLDHGSTSRALNHLITQKWLLKKSDDDDELLLGPRSVLQMQYAS
jgi:hypothetical protein